MILGNTIQYSQKNPFLTILLFVIIVALNIYLTIEIGPYAPGFSFVIGTIGSLVGILIGVYFAPKTKIASQFNADIQDIVTSL